MEEQYLRWRIGNQTFSVRGTAKDVAALSKILRLAEQIVSLRIADSNGKILVDESFQVANAENMTRHGNYIN